MKPDFGSTQHGAVCPTTKSSIAFSYSTLAIVALHDETQTSLFSTPDILPGSGKGMKRHFTSVCRNSNIAEVRV